MITLHHGDCLHFLPTFPENSFDAVVTDPPYGLGKEPPIVDVLSCWLQGKPYAPSGGGFMGKKWDAFVPGPEYWREVIRVMKPGAFLLCFAGTRTDDLMGIALRLAGFERRDLVAWLFGAGFNKVGIIRNADGEPVRDGWAGALKPALEPVLLCRKPFKGSLRKNLQQWGTGALNVDGCRINPGERVSGGGNGKANHGGRYGGSSEYAGERPVVQPHTHGRWPANVIHDGSGEVLAEFAKAGERHSGGRNGAKRPHDDFGTFQYREHDTGKQYDASTGSAARFFYCAKASPGERNAGCEGLPEKVICEADGRNNGLNSQYRIENGNVTGTKANSSRARNHHPTVKPIALMRYLCRLITPPGGTVLDPFAGSGTTLCACELEHFNGIGIEREEEYLPIIRARLAHWEEQRQQDEEQPSLLEMC
ncbi:MAG: DNA-methyltransferase [Armatimonadota bacterium]